MHPKETGSLSIVTAADNSHFRSLCQFLESAGRYEMCTPLVVYDLGLLSEQRNVITELFPNIELVGFDYDAYPDYFNIKCDRGAYAWKPALIRELFERTRGDLIWFDSGCLITETLSKIRKILADVGVYSPRSSGTVKDWTHHLTLDFLNADDQLFGQPNFSGACLAVSRHFENKHGLLRRWYECSLSKACIAPDGSDRSNHRQDQAVLSVLLHQLDIPGVAPEHKLGFKLHQDVNNRIKTTSKRRELVLQVRSGLSNRLRTYLSAEYLAKQFGRELRLVWMPDAGCGASWRDLFENSVVELRTMPENVPIFDAVDLGKLHRELASARSVICIKDMRYLTPKRLQRQIVGYLDQLRPTDDVAARMDSLTERFDCPVMGVHVRRVDFARFLFGKGAALPPIEQYFPYMDDWSGHFFVATDGGPEIEDIFINRYGQRVIIQNKTESGRNTKESIKEALIDLFALRQCKHLVATNYSSFSTLAVGRNTEFVKVTCPLPWNETPLFLHRKIGEHYKRCLRQLSSD